MREISFRPIKASDASVINKIRNQSVEFLHDNSMFSVKETAEWIERVCPDWYAILLNDEMVGYFRISNYSEKNRNLYIGADIEESHRGKGLGYESYLLMMEKLFKERKLNKIALEVLSNNERAYSLYKKLGFSVEGTKRQEVWRNGFWVDSIVMSITRIEFMLNHENIIPSPCVGICHRNEYVCATCGRTIEQITNWSRSTDDAKRIHIASARPNVRNTIK